MLAGSLEEARRLSTTPIATNTPYIDATWTSFLIFSFLFILSILFRIISLILSIFVDILSSSLAVPAKLRGCVAFTSCFSLSHQYLHCLHSTIESEFSTLR